MKLNLPTKVILIIEDYPVMRNSIRAMLNTLGAETIFEAENGDAAIALMNKQKFDIVLCDYNLGAGKNGQQILEEARHNKLISLNTLFIIVTAHQTTSFVLNTIECKPDEYLAKPFNPQQLLRRLEKSSQRKQYLSVIEKELDQGNTARAIYHCDKLLKNDNKIIRSQLLKIRADLAINVADYEKASKIYQDILKQRELSWARLGTAIVAFFQNEYQLSINILQELIEQNPRVMESYDWLAKSFQALEQNAEAEETMRQATEISPHSLSRQKSLAVLAEKMGNLDIAEKAYLATTQLSEYSIHKAPSDFSNLAKIYCKKNEPNLALKTLDHMRHQFHNNQEAELRAAIIETELYQTTGNSEQSVLAYQKILQLKNLIKEPGKKDLQLDLAKACYLNKDIETVDNIISSLINNHMDDDSFIDQIRVMYKDLGDHNHAEMLIENAKQTLKKINNQGVELFQKGQIKEALAIFEQAIDKMPENKTIVLNMLKISLHDLKTSGITEENLLLTQRYLKKAYHMGVSAKKLVKLQLEFEKITQSYATTS